MTDEGRVISAITTCLRDEFKDDIMKAPKLEVTDTGISMAVFSMPLEVKKLNLCKVFNAMLDEENDIVSHAEFVYQPDGASEKSSEIVIFFNQARETIEEGIKPSDVVLNRFLTADKCVIDSGHRSMFLAAKHIISAMSIVYGRMPKQTVFNIVVLPDSEIMLSFPELSTISLAIIERMYQSAGFFIKSIVAVNVGTLCRSLRILLSAKRADITLILRKERFEGDSYEKKRKRE